MTEPTKDTRPPEVRTLVARVGYGAADAENLLRNGEVTDAERKAIADGDADAINAVIARAEAKRSKTPKTDQPPAGSFAGQVDGT